MFTIVRSSLFRSSDSGGQKQGRIFMPMLALVTGFRALQRRAPGRSTGGLRPQDGGEQGDIQRGPRPQEDISSCPDSVEGEENRAGTARPSPEPPLRCGGAAPAPLLPGASS